MKGYKDSHSGLPDGNTKMKRGALDEAYDDSHSGMEGLIEDLEGEKAWGCLLVLLGISFYLFIAWIFVSLILGLFL